jgi:DNA-binding MarR family transcriptional regulator
MARWLNSDEMLAWRRIVAVEIEIRSALDSELSELHDISLGEFGVLAHLGEASEGRLRMTDLAERMRLSPSGLTRRLNRLVDRKFVDRVSSDDDRRVTMAVLTVAGSELLKKASPDLLDGVRRHLLDHVSELEIKQLGSILSQVLVSRRSAGL